MKRTILVMAAALSLSSCVAFRDMPLEEQNTMRCFADALAKVPQVSNIRLETDHHLPWARARVSFDYNDKGKKISSGFDIDDGNDRRHGPYTTVLRPWFGDSQPIYTATGSRCAAMLAPADNGAE